MTSNDGSATLTARIAEFLYLEARMLDEGRRGDWLGLFAEDAQYRVPGRESVLHRARGGASNVVIRDDLAFDLVNDDRSMLATRVGRLDSGLSHVEQPEAVTVRMITNVLASVDGDAINASSNFHVVQMRYERSRSNPIDHLFGRREDTLRKSGDSFLIVHRVVILAQPLIDKGLSVML